MTEILEFEYKKVQLDLYNLEIPAITSESPVCQSVCFNGPVSHNGIVIGKIRYNNTVVLEEKNLTSSMVTVTFDDEFNSSISWIMTWVYSTPYYPPNAKYILNLVSGSGIYLNKTGVIVIDVTPTDRHFYVKFDN